jgi:hypothetical protein
MRRFTPKIFPVLDTSPKTQCTCCKPSSSSTPVVRNNTPMCPLLCQGSLLLADPTRSTAPHHHHTQQKQNNKRLFPGGSTVHVLHGQVPVPAAGEGEGGRARAERETLPLPGIEPGPCWVRTHASARCNQWWLGSVGRAPTTRYIYPNWAYQGGAPRDPP